MSLVVWIHGGGWVSGDRRRTRQMPSFFKEHDILFASANYPLEASTEISLVNLQILALQGLDRWLSDNPLKTKYPGAFGNIVLLAHSAGAHLVALAEKLNGWNSQVSAIVLMDSSAYDLETRYLHARPKQRQQFAHLIGLDTRPHADHGSVLRSYSPALIPSQIRKGPQLRVIIVTSQRPGAYYSAKKLEKSFAAPGYQSSFFEFNWSHDQFPAAIGADQQMNNILLSAVSPISK